ncbi:3TM-type holin [Hydrogenophaga sp.]|uniref:3TM-type holin n=1 Tax=Hydrogenophaga sp. TaxID=1904254 RepID=UPI002721E356|nr:3TM-type holin [Hydrogenophaga sp.]MDO9131957.1 3TM-type holin [Hydrogenophaga sp.]
MNPLILGSVFELGKDLISRFFPDKTEAARVEAEFLRMAAQGELQQVIAQLEINAKEAAHPSVFVAGWRPAFGWAGCAGFVYAVIVQPLLAWWAATKGLPTPPELNMDLLWVVITGMLGIGGLRTFEKSKGVSK